MTPSPEEARYVLEMIGWGLLGAAVIIWLPDGHGPGKCKPMTRLEREAYKKEHKDD